LVIERAFVTLDEGQMHLRRLRPAATESCPLILLHASPTSSYFMQGLMQALIETGTPRELIAPDTLGNGDSAPPSPAHPDIAYFADSLRRLLDALGIEQADVYGSHTGARIACEFAAAFPQRARRVILDGIIEYDDATRQLVVENYAPTVPPDDYGRHFIWAFNFVRDQAIYFPYFQRDPAHRLGGAMPDAAKLHRATLDVLKALDTYSKPYIAAFEYRAYARMPLIKAPVLLLRPESELPVLNAAIAEATARLPDARVAVVAGTDVAKAAAIATFLDAKKP
jgi:pimeloyl-ACP methyl ester carboxylesterase